MVVSKAFKVGKSFTSDPLGMQREHLDFQLREALELNSVLQSLNFTFEFFNFFVILEGGHGRA